MTYIPAPDRYKSMTYRRCGKSGIKLPVISLGLWHNFGNITPFGVQQELLRTGRGFTLLRFSSSLTNR